MSDSSTNEECSIFRDLYTNYGFDEVEEDTREWMLEHEKKCGKCRIWIESFKNNILNKGLQESFYDDERAIKNAKLIIFIGIGIVVLLGIGTSIWMFI